MVYAAPTNLYDDQNTFYAQSPGASGSPVQVFYNGTGLHSIAGPVPLVDITKTYNRTEGGILQSTLNRIEISGKVLRIGNESNVTPAGTGTTAILGAVSGLDNLFKCDQGVFQIKCGSSVLFSGSGVKVTNFSANKSSDNWIFSADYSVGLEFYEPASSGSSYLIKKGNDSWSLEPLEEYVYSDFNLSVKQRSEYHNPKLKNTALPFSPGSNPPSSKVPNNDGDVIELRVLNIPQFKLSRKLSAEGIPSPSGSGNTCASSGNYSAYKNAQKWIEAKLAEPFNGANTTSGLPVFNTTNITTITNFQHLFLYNHLRSISFDHLAGTYEVSETWLAMPTGMRYIEDYTIEASTDEKYIKTVRVQGNIRGLSMSALPIMSGASGLVPNSGSGGAHISLSGYMSGGLSGSMNSLPVPDITGATSYDPNFYANKYQNAVSGWLNDIKPYLYRRACLGMNSSDRNISYIQPNVSPQPAPGNPTYSYERHLNIIPLSTSENHDPRKGTISYTYEFNNRLKILSGVIAENITISDTGPIDVINQAFVLGRRLGPVIQALGTRTNATKTVVVDIVVVPPTSIADCLITSSGCPVWTGGTTYSTINQLIEGFKPFGDRINVFGGMNRSGSNTPQGQVYATQNDHSWSPTEGRFTRSVSWVYQTCDITRFYLDH